MWALLSAAWLLAAWLAGTFLERSLLVRCGQFAAGVSTLLPAIAVLGAKRPQDRAWQWVVASLGVILLLPMALQTLLPQRGPLVHHGVYRSFVIVISLVGLLNWLPTRHAPSAVLTALAQFLLLGPALGLAPFDAAAAQPVGMTLYGLSLVISPFASRAPAKETLTLDDAWRSFRDRFGAFWAARVWLRWNQAADQHHWPQRLTWQGFRPTPPPPTPAPAQATTRTFRTLLRRFESPERLEKLNA